MPAIRLNNVAAGTADALNGLKFKVQPRPFLLSLFGSTAVAGGTLSLSVGNREVLVNAPVNVEAVADAIDTDRDQILWREMCPAGEIFLPVGAQICNFLVVIEPL